MASSLLRLMASQWKGINSILLWMLCGAVFWHCAHSITLIFPLPGPWLPTDVAWVTGIIMGFLGRSLFGRYPAPMTLDRKQLFVLLGAASGAYLGWVSARGGLTPQESFLLPSATEQLLAAVVCGGLGLASNFGMSWLMENRGDRPFRVLQFLLCLLLLMFAAVSLLFISARSSSSHVIQ